VPFIDMAEVGEIPAAAGDSASQPVWDASCMFGNRQARIEKVVLADVAGRSIHTVRTRVRVSLRMWCHTSVRLLSPIVGFLVRDRLGQSLFGTNVCVGNQGNLIQRD
jgi:hypothetical protein